MVLFRKSQLLLDQAPRQLPPPFPVSSHRHEHRLRRDLFSACPDARAGRCHAGRRLADRAPQSAGRRIRGGQRHAPAFRACCRAGQSRPAADRLHPRRQRQSEGPDGAAQALARRPRRAAVLRPAGAWLVRARRRQRDAVRPGQNAGRIDGRTRHRPGDHRRPFLRRGRGGGIRARLSRRRRAGSCCWRRRRIRGRAARPPGIIR